MICNLQVEIPQRLGIGPIYKTTRQPDIELQYVTTDIVQQLGRHI